MSFKRKEPPRAADMPPRTKTVETNRLHLVRVYLLVEHIVSSRRDETATWNSYVGETYRA